MHEIATASYVRDDDQHIVAIKAGHFHYSIYNINL